MKINEIIKFKLFAVVLSLAMLAPVAWADNPTGNGTLTINPGGTSGSCDAGGSGFNDFDSPHWWDIQQNDMIHINITAAQMICTVGKTYDSCSQNSDCNTTSGKCNANNTDGVCTPDTTGTCSKTPFNSCTSDSQCTTSGSHCNFPSHCTAGLVGKGCTSSSQCNTTSCSANSPAHAGDICTATSDPWAPDDTYCNIAGKCEQALECSGVTNVVIQGDTGDACTSDGDCSGPCDTGTNTCQFVNRGCTSDADCGQCDSGPGLCRFVDSIPTTGRTGNGDIDVCYKTHSNTCSQARILYCDGLLANNENPSDTGHYQSTFLRTVSIGDSCTTDADCPSNAHCGYLGKCEIELNDSASCTPLAPDTCKNEIGSLCCGLTQGAYGAPKSTATYTGTTGDCSGTDLGFIPAAKCAGYDIFDGDPNATTVGIHPTRSVTIDTLAALISYLPAGGTPKALANNTGDKHYPPATSAGGTSKGDGGGTLTGETMAVSINAFLSDAGFGPTGGGSFTPSGFSGFTLPSSAPLVVCTRRSGPDLVLGNSYDICQAFVYPSCVAGKTVQDVIDCANDQLGKGSNSCGCTASQLVVALDNQAYAFDECGYVIDCGSHTTAGVFDCQ
jgi:hypothetical protein